MQADDVVVTLGEILHHHVVAVGIDSVLAAEAVSVEREYRELRFCGFGRQIQWAVVAHEAETGCYADKRYPYAFDLEDKPEDDEYNRGEQKHGEGQ